MKGSSAISSGPSISAQLTSGERCAAALAAMALSTIQPSMTFNPIARAVWIIASAPRMPPVFASFTLTPSMQPLSGGRSLATKQSSSATIGMLTRSLIARSHCGFPAGTGCSQNSISYRCSSRSVVIASSTVQPSLASMRIAPPITRANRGDHLDVVRGRAAADLHFEDRILRRFVDLAQHLVRLRDPDRK